MRQVDRDELAYVIYCGLRIWTISTRKRVFAPIAKRNDANVRIACDQVAARMGYFEVIDPARAEQPLKLAEISAILFQVVDRAPGAIAKLWTSGEHVREKEAQATLANLFADAFESFEVLADTPLGRGVNVTFPAVDIAPHALRPTWP